MERLNTLVSQVHDPGFHAQPSAIRKTAYFEVVDLFKRRKRYSNNYFKTRIKEYYTGSLVPIDDKIDYARELGKLGDLELTEYVRSYFEAAVSRGELESDDESAAIALLSEGDVPE